MGLLTRLRSRLRGSSAPSTLGAHFSPALVDEWKELEEQIDGELKKAGSSVVGAWEVGAAELGRAVVGLPEDKALVERFSDALVPTLQPFQDLHKGIGPAMAEGLREGLARGTMEAATAPLARLLTGLDERAALGWLKSVDHLDPILALSPRPDEARDRLFSGERALRQACVDADEVWRGRLAALPAAPGLWVGLTGAAEAWQLSITRAIEIALDAQTKTLVAAVRAGRD